MVRVCCYPNLHSSHTRIDSKCERLALVGEIYHVKVKNVTTNEYRGLKRLSMTMNN